MSKTPDKYTTWAIIGLIVGAAFGTLIFSFTLQAWHIAAATGIGLVMGSAIGLRRQKHKQQKTNNPNTPTSAPAKENSS